MSYGDATESRNCVVARDTACLNGDATDVVGLDGNATKSCNLDTACTNGGAIDAVDPNDNATEPCNLGAPVITKHATYAACTNGGTTVFVRLVADVSVINADTTDTTGFNGDATLSIPNKIYPDKLPRLERDQIGWRDET